jgi:hypothetical protein
MNGARVGISAQGIGIAQAAYLEGMQYARAREQFGTAIVNMPLVYEMLINSRVNIEAARVLLFNASEAVDLKRGYELELERTENPSKELRQKAKYYSSLAALLTPMSKYLSTEYANKVSYDMLQVHGGTGFMKDFNIERHYRDARITNIYEGTTQLQFVAAMGGVITRVMEPELDRMESLFTEDFHKPYLKELKEKRELLNKTIDYIKQKEDHTYQSYHSGRIVDMATKLYTSYLFLKYAPFSDNKKKTTNIFFEREMAEIEKNYAVITSGKSAVIDECSALLSGE